MTSVYPLVRNHAPAAVAIISISLFYWWEMVSVTPWYDELYTYMEFISKGMRYVTTHWPLPNNHILSNLLSAGIAHLTDSQIVVLRGVSFVSLVVSMLVLYAWISSWLDRKAGVAAVIAFALGTFAACLGVQGRGYSLAMLLYIVSLVACTRITRGASVGKWYAAWALSIALAMYDVPSNLYWIFLLFAGTAFLLRSRPRDLALLAVSSGVGVVLTFLLYSPVWLTTASDAGITGSLPNRLLYGLGRMLEDRFIQSITREEWLSGLGNWLESLGSSVHYGWGAAALIAMGMALSVLMIGCLRHPKSGCASNDDDTRVVIVLLSTCFFGIFPITAVQCVLPFTRTLCFIGVAEAVLFATALHRASKLGHGVAKYALSIAAAGYAASILFCYCSYSSDGFFNGYDGGRTGSVRHVLERVLDGRDSDRLLLGDTEAELTYSAENATIEDHFPQ